MGIYTPQVFDTVPQSGGVEIVYTTTADLVSLPTLNTQHVLATTMQFS